MTNLEIEEIENEIFRLEKAEQDALARIRHLSAATLVFLQQQNACIDDTETFACRSPKDCDCLRLLQKIENGRIHYSYAIGDWRGQLK